MTKTKTTSAPYPFTTEEKFREFEAWWSEIDRGYDEEMARQEAERKKQAKQKEK